MFFVVVGLCAVNVVVLFRAVDCIYSSEIKYGREIGSRQDTSCGKI